MKPVLGRRQFLVDSTTQVALLAVVPSRSGRSPVSRGLDGLKPRRSVDQTTRLTAQMAPIEPSPLQALALQAVDAARAAGASYADARLTRSVYHDFLMHGGGDLMHDVERIGVGVRVLANGAWGFAASLFWEPDAVVRLARNAVTQAQANAIGAHRTVGLAPVPVVTGTWTTPIVTDPFTITLEEKFDSTIYWKTCALRQGLQFKLDGMGAVMRFMREERILATSEGSLTIQTVYESGCRIQIVDIGTAYENEQEPMYITGLEQAGKGWEMFLDAQIPTQINQIKEHWRANISPKLMTKPATVGRYTLVCDGRTMASLLEQTLGVATQLDRALGYEANAGGTSFINDPLAMVGTLKIASPLVTVIANRSIPGQLATVQWDDEGVAPKPFTIVKDGVLVDFQTTREQAAWLAPYYQAQGQPVVSHGCAAAESAHLITQQMMPNLALEPSVSTVRLEDLVADVADGILIEEGRAEWVDFQAKNGLLQGRMREIKAGKLGPRLLGGVVRFNTQHLWNNVQQLGGPATSQVQGYSQYGERDDFRAAKGQPPQSTSHSVQGVAAIITNQAIINVSREA